MPHVLLIEDNPGDALLIREMYRDATFVEEPFRITHVTRIGDAVKHIADDTSISLIMSDMSLPDSQGMETLSTLTTATTTIPIIFMTGSNDMAFVTAALKAGAQDYLVKGTIDAQVLARATLYSIERKKSQLNIEAAKHKAAELTMSRNRLKKQKEELIELNKAKDDFISLSSHQLRTPATSVKQYLGMIMDGFAGDVPENLQLFIRTAYESNERQLTIINDLLKTARLDSGRYSLEKTQVDVCAMISEIILDYQPIMAMRHQIASFEKDSQCTAEVDAAEIKIAISNLIENASKYSPENSTIHIYARTADNTLIVGVRDSGVGIPAHDLEKIFDKFTRIDNELSDTVSGSGLGLYFVDRIITMHGGHVDVSSKIGKGSEFSFRIPVAA